MNDPSLSLFPGFWDRVRTAAFPILALDYDGTLAPFHEDPMQAFPLPGISSVLKKIVRKGRSRLVLISGRPLEELRVMLDIPACYVGSHGTEIMYENGRVLRHPPSPLQCRGLDQARSFFGQEIKQGRVENKLSSVALHVRGLARKTAMETIHQIQTVWGKLALEYDLELLDFDGGVEIRARGMTKGHALLNVIQSLPQQTDLIVYLGDDITDEDVFRRLPSFGIGIRVGTHARATAAITQIADCSEVLIFLKTWFTIRSTTYR